MIGRRGKVLTLTLLATMLTQGSMAGSAPTSRSYSEAGLFEMVTTLIVRVFKAPRTLADMSNRYRLSQLINRIASDAALMSDIKGRILASGKSCPANQSPPPAERLIDALDDMTSGLADLQKVAYLTPSEQQQLGAYIERLRGLDAEKGAVIRLISLCVDPRQISDRIRRGADAASRMSVRLHVLAADVQTRTR